MSGGYADPTGTNSVFPHRHPPPVPMGLQPSSVERIGYTDPHSVHRPSSLGSFLGRLSSGIYL